LGEKLSITFLENPNVETNKCNPIIEAAYQSDEQAMPLEITMNINVKQRKDVTVIMLPSRVPGLLIGRAPMSSTSDMIGTCKQMHLRLSKLECRDSTGVNEITCPRNRKTDGLRMFGYVNVSY